jgi:ribosome-associated heat shock protein Hsp15
MRLDKWLWHARFFKTRSLAQRYVEKARCRLDGRVTDKPHATVAPGMVLTFALGPKVRVIRILALGERRGPAPKRARCMTKSKRHDAALRPCLARVKQPAARSWSL